MVGGQYVLITAERYYGEAPSVVYVELGYCFGTNFHFVLSYGGNGISREGCWSVGGILELGFGGADAFPSMGKMTLTVFFGRRALLGGASLC